MAIAFRSSFNRTHEDTATAAKTASSKFAADISAETAQAIRNIVTDAVTKGIPPRDAAKLIRGVIGLNTKQGAAVSKMFGRLIAQGKSTEVAATLAHRKAQQYLRQRALTIARTEIMRAENTGQRLAWDQAVANGTIAPRSQKTWIVANDDRLCPYCADLDGTTVPLTGVFQSSIATVSEPPLHPNCRCTTGLVPVRVRVPVGRPGAGAAPTGEVATPGGRKIAETARQAELALRAEVDAAHTEAVALVQAEKAAAEQAQKAAIEAAQKAAIEKVLAEQKAVAEKAAWEAHHKAMVEKEAALAQAQALALKEKLAAQAAEATAKKLAQRSVGSTTWLDDLMTRRVGPQAGSNPGGLFEDALGKKFYVKQYANEKQAMSEAVSNAIYRELGLGGPRSWAVRNSAGQMHFVSEIVTNTGTIGKLGLTKARADHILKGFSADVLTVNWDAVGTGLDNVVLGWKKVVRIDQGGTLMFRAQGGAKPLSVFNDISEWDTFYSKNAYYRQVFEKAGVFGANELGAKAIAQIDDIEKLREKLGTGGWNKFVRKALGTSARGQGEFINETARLLQARTELLLQKRAQLQAIGSAPVHKIATPGSWPIADNQTRAFGSRYPEEIRRRYQSNMRGLTKAQHEAIKEFSSSSAGLNEVLRSNPSRIPERAKPMQDAIMASSTRPPDLVWRGIYQREVDSMTGFRPGDIVAMNGFKSTSLSPSFASGWGGGAVLEIKPKYGLYINDISHFKNEYEFILPHGKQYRFLGRKLVPFESGGMREVWQFEALD